MRAPKNVPQERIETMSDEWESVSLVAVMPSTAVMKILEPETPLM
jgi:hypothetical protein